MNELSKARVTVSMDRGLWAEGKVRAHENRVSFSGYIEGLMRSNLNHPGGGQLDRIESKLDKLLRGHWTPKPEIAIREPTEEERESIIPSKKVRSDDEVLREAQEKKVKLKSPGNGLSFGYSKERQLGKKK